MTIRTAAQAGVTTPLLSAVDEVNHRRRQQVVERAAALLDGTVRDRRVALLGLTFKPDTDDLRDAPALTIAQAFIDGGATVVAYDPMPSARARSTGMVPGLIVAETAAEAIEGADIAVLVTEWPEFLELDWNTAGATMRRRVVVDGRNVLSGPRLMAAGFAFSSFGRGTFVPEGDVSRPQTATLGWMATFQAAEG